MKIKKIWSYIRKISLGTKLTVLFVAAQVFIGFVLIIISVNYMKFSLVTQRKVQLEHSANMLVTTVLPNVFNNEFFNLQVQIDRFIENDPIKEIIFIGVYDREGRAIVTRGRSGFTGGITAVNENNSEILKVSKSILYEDEYFGRIDVYSSQKHINDTIKLIGFILTALFTSFVVATISWTILIVTQIVIRPLLQLVEGTKRISEGNLNQRVETNSVDELGQLAETFNAMASSLKNRQEELSRTHQQLASSYQDLKQLDEMKSEFMALAAHELRTPLTALKAHTEIFLRGQYGSLSNHQKKALEIIERSVGRLARFIDDLMDITRLEKGELKLEKRPLDLSNLLVEIVREVQPVIGESNLDISYNIPNNLPVIIGDSQRLYQVFGNLLNNAVKFTPDKGKISVIAKQEDGFVKVSVSDSGIGISEDDLPRLFIPFYQVKKMPLRGVKGVGLGLVVAKKIVEDLGGKIEASSEINKGSTFTCIFPVAEDVKREM